jgi:SulP family sulfate permease
MTERVNLNRLPPFLVVLLGRPAVRIAKRVTALVSSPLRPGNEKNFHGGDSPQRRAHLTTTDQVQPVSSAEDGRHGFSAWLHRAGAVRGDVVGGLTAAVVLLAVEGSYGLVAFDKLGPGPAQLGFVLTVFAAAISAIVTVAAGARGPMLSGSSAALALLVSSLIAVLATDRNFVGVDGSPLASLVMGFVGLAVVLSGAIQALAAALGLGGLVRYVPYPVHAGYMNGTAILMTFAMLPHLLGLPPGRGLVLWQQAQPLAPVVGLAAFLLAIKPPAWTRRVPAYMVALASATFLHHLLAFTPAGAWLGPLFSPPPLRWPSFDVLEPTVAHMADEVVLGKLWLVVQFAAAMAFISGLQTALAGATVDELTHRRRSLGRELFAQGVANMALGAIGSPAAAGAVGRSKINLDAGGRTCVSRIFFGIGLVVALVVGLSYMRIVPMAAIAGVFCAVAYSLIDAWTKSATRVMWRQTLKWRVPRALGVNYGVMVLVAGIAVVVSLPVAIGVGMLVAILMFIRSNSKEPVRQIVHADVRRSRKVRPADEADLLKAHGKRIVVIELDGALFFGTAEEADREIEHRITTADFIVVDFERVSEVDASGARVMLQAADHVRRAGKMLLLAGLAPKDHRTRMIRDMDVHGRLSDASFFPDADRALEFAEDHLLGALQPAMADRSALTLDETLICEGFSAAERQVLGDMLIERRLRKGESVFRRGDPGEAMYVLLQGQIGIWLSAAVDEHSEHRGRRLVSYAPGVVFGEMGLLAAATRSADAIAESDALVLELKRSDYDRLASEHPAILGKLLLNISLLLASRVRALTDELEAAQAVR